MPRTRGDLPGAAKSNGISLSDAKPKIRRLPSKEENLVLWKSPLRTAKYATLEVVSLLQLYGRRLILHRKLIIGLVTFLTLTFLLCYTPGYHQQFVQLVKKKGFFIFYWAGLGVLSSVGLGTGLHTFILYLGPHIASVTLAAYECNSLDFPEPPYPNEFLINRGRTIPGFYNGNETTSKS
ncbi:vacuole membrane protein 1-like isoform X2 [Topomyia yanbarensis]|uniref:vacuole membrane protein 1-like isoform X2 n=1 Tax=Topomyia yanbarensis TaxID=2498891 RepID=UPI00273C5416|nr:vacuole membrane protein 1-like isoform X2 [Topomyia yanbarensis]